MKVGAFAATFIAIGLIAYQHQPSIFALKKESVATSLPPNFAIQAQLLTYSKFANVATVNSLGNTIEIQVPVESLFFKKSTAMSVEAERQFGELVQYLDSLHKNSKFEVSLVGVPDSDFNPKFRSTRVRKLASEIEEAGVAASRIEKVWQVLLDPSVTRETASEAGPNASADFIKNQYFSIRILTAN